MYLQICSENKKIIHPTLVCGFVFFVLQALCQGKVLIMTLAQVKDHVITDREVAIHRALVSVPNIEFENFGEKSSPKEQVIREWLLFYEAMDFYSRPIRDSKWKNQLKQIKKSLGAVPSWRELKVSDKELREKIKRHFQAKRFYIFKKKASLLSILLVEVKDQYIKDKAKYQSMDFDQVKDKIREMLSQKRIEQWFRVLKAKYKLQHFSM